jgi:mRNA interferase RelE/StbE
MKLIVYSKSAQRALISMPRNWALRVREKIEAFAQDPASLANNVRSLRGEVDILRLRVGDWRVIMRDGIVLDILEVKPRGSAYKE